MTKDLFATFVLLIALVFGFQHVSAQFTINLPKLPKIKKEKPKVEQPSEQQAQPQPTSLTTDYNQSEQSNGSQSADNKSVAPPDKCEEKDWWITNHLYHIAEWQQDVDTYMPPDRSQLLLHQSNDNYLLYAVSPKARAGWLKDLKDCPKIVTALDTLAASAAKILPTYKADLLDYRFHNPAEEKLMRSLFQRPADLTIFAAGFEQNSWLIDKNDYGLPTARFKRGVIYLRDAKDDHPYCFLSYTNVIQDYAGGGTYGASYARYIRDELVGCPTGK